MIVYDSVVCGAGPAGAVAAIALQQQGFSVLLVEKSRFPRAKLCGEFLGPDSVEPLQRLGLWDTVRQAAHGPVRECVFYLQNGSSVTIDLGCLNRQYPYGLGITRRTLDTLLLEKARSLGVQIAQPARVFPQIEQENGEFRLTLERSDAGPQPALETVHTGVVIDASGRHGGLFLGRPLQRQAPAKPAARLIGMKVNVRLTACPDPARLSMFFIPQGYGGVQPLPGDRLANLCLVAPAQGSANLHRPFADWLDATLGQNPAAMALIENAVPVEPFQTTANLDFNWRCQRSAGLIRLGDAMVTVDPVTGSGMSIAMQTGVLAADTIAQGLSRGWSYENIRQAYVRQYRKHFSLRLAILRQLRPLLFSASLQQSLLPLLRPGLPLLARCIR